MACLSEGVGLLANSFWVLGSVLPALVVLRYAVIAKEERYLTERFGEPYREYRARVRRWL
jgi:protein-S-isoprenylcysteine O-methyltransferase Ste14